MPYGGTPAATGGASAQHRPTKGSRVSNIAVRDGTSLMAVVDGMQVKVCHDVVLINPEWMRVDQVSGERTVSASASRMMNMVSCRDGVGSSFQLGIYIRRKGQMSFPDWFTLPPQCHGSVLKFQ